VVKTVVPIINESENKEEPPINLVGERKWKQVTTIVNKTLT
jgi:hypothetical protein